MSGALSFRPITEADREFLQRVYASTREQELAIVQWDASQKEAFLRMQFDAQHVHYRQYYPDARHEVILLDGESIGRLYVDRREDEIRIVDISLLPGVRRKGIGTTILKALLSEAAAAGKPVRIHVEHNNPAMRFYRRLGFKKLGETGVYYLMECSPTT